ncbi:MAG: permease, glycerol uptake facilitator [Actinobacteria bacterium BACL4 MAG-120820-bin23]|jgi:glycerol uptake facilitator-like aquaporin|uniref:aquaporin n=1 Tax=Candidatus Nanopelagicus sp. TaxID=2518620 RepID=UPI0007132A40|nr:MAG: permease, glycerol uptake facilitator [Actinobacteria bacterium BACL4 MAG-121022-bin9]KRO50110.1 MAG: permease, glycerol uptake facilitator [Actinobacteria bacterium BACL4 MAG-120820-bin23]KRO51653.1 MAG: permease, glycerol uptake facilitator [Actinobacteria bacterium BACL4 MAG-121001-bin59]KRO77437.1 MAG: permease, glycerol uptake facilitator [Actinobacteria bacterium BACL4 MAG-120920-bin74]KRO92409.1 MAG: permease, glycerol uptake facilitator [Actinobacteria bacterium BACL4 MAG-120507
MKQQRAVIMEFLGTAILAVGIVGSGHMLTSLGADNGLELFVNALATAIALAIAIRIGMKISGSYFNPAVSLVMLLLKKIKFKIFLLYVVAQTLGAISGTILANFMFNQQVLAQSEISRDGSNLFLSEIFATMVLLWIILRFPKRDDLVAIYVPLWIFGAILFTSSTSFANPAITVGRVFTSSIVGIAPASVLLFIIAQLLGGLLGLLVAKQITNPDKTNDE